MLLSFVALWASIHGAVAASDPRSCLARMTPIPSESLVREAVRMLKQAGHDPADFAVELRMESATRPDADPMGRDLKPSVIFHPRQTGYALRVHSAIPCGVGWVWRPGRFTAWQSEVVARASEAVRRARPSGSSEPSDVQVAESSDHLGVYVWTGPDGESAGPDLTVIMRKSDLSVVGVTDDSRVEAMAQ
jgi:hypothetical protein